jgi:hypothetical protein
MPQPLTCPVIPAKARTWGRKLGSAFLNPRIRGSDQ